MELTNKKEIYSVANTGTALKLSGEITIMENSDIASFNGHFTTLEGAMAGSFNYRETNNVVDKNIYGIVLASKVEASELIDITVDEIKLQLQLQ